MRRGDWLAYLAVVGGLVERSPAEDVGAVDVAAVVTEQQVEQRQLRVALTEHARRYTNIK